MKSKIIIIALFLCPAFSASFAANTIYVDAGSPNDPGTGTYIDPFRRIQPAINATIDGDTVIIRQGIYSGSDNYNLDPGGRLITIRSEDPNNATVVANTIIDPQHNDRGFNIHSDENKNCIISGLTIINGSAFSEANDVYDGGGIFCMGTGLGNGPTISHCVIKNGYARRASCES